MLDVLNLALPFFGLILLGLVCGRLNRIPEFGLAWMGFFIVYVALPALFYRILAQTPLDQLAQGRFILATTLSALLAFVIAFAIALLARRQRPGNKIAEATIIGCAGSYGNVGYMGPRSRALDARLRRGRTGRADLRTVALRRFDRVPWEVPVLGLIKLVVHPAIALVVLSLLGPFAGPWMATAVLMAALPPALNVFVMARQYDVWVTPASGSVLIGTLMSIVTLTAIMWMVKTQALPLPLFH